MATPDSGDNEVCDIINCVAIYDEKGASGNAFLRKEKVSSTDFKESEVAQSFERNCQVCVLFKSYL